jgi:hypothetical protein
MLRLYAEAAAGQAHGSFAIGKAGAAADNAEMVVGALGDKPCVL